MKKDKSFDMPFDVAHLISYTPLYNEIKLSEFYSDLFISQEELPNIERLVNQVFQEELLGYVVKSLEDVTGTTHNEEFWGITVAPWLMWLVQTCYMNYTHLGKFVKRYGEQESSVVLLRDAPFILPPATSTDLFRILQQREFHVWVLSMYLQNSLPKNWTSGFREVEVITPYSAHISNWSTLKKNVFKFLRNLRCTSDEIPLRWRIAFSLALRLKKLNYGSEKGTLHGVEQSDGKKCTLSEFTSITKLIIDQCIPLWYRNGFLERYSAYAKRTYHPGFGRIVHSDTFNDEDNFKKAFAIERGEVVFSVQHGGGYGIHKVFCLSPQSEYIGSEFITWGWRKHESYQVNAVPLPSPSLSRLKALRKRAKVGKKIIFVGTEMSFLRLRIHSKPIGPDWLNYREQKVSFLSALSSIGYDNVYYRPGSRGTFRDYEFLQEVFPEISICNGSYKEFHRDLQSARLCIVDHPITTLHQVLAMNIPTVAYWNPNHWKLSRQSITFFSELEQVGILHHSGEQAGRFVSDNFDRIEEWWNADETQAARLRWCHVYARTSETWLRDWILALWFKKSNKSKKT